MDRRAGLLIALGCACEAPGSLPPAELAELCGQPGPVQVLPLDERSVVLADEDTTLKVGDRYLYVVRRVAEGRSAYPVGRARIEGLGATTQIVSVDRCGRDRTVVAEGLETIYAPRGDDGPFVGVHFRSGQLHWFDRHGRWPSQPIAIPKAWAALDARSLVVWRESRDDVVIATLVGDGPASEVEVVLDGVRRIVFATPESPTVASGTAVALREDGVLVWIDLHRRTIEPLRSGVEWIDAGPEGSWFVYTVPAPAERYWGAPRALWLYERATGTSQRISANVSYDWGYDFVASSGEDDDPTRIVLLPRRAGITLGGRWDVRERLPRGGVVVRSWDGDEEAAITLGDDGLAVVPLADDPLSYGEAFAFYRDPAPYMEFPEGERPFDLLGTSLRTGDTEIVQRRMWSGVALPRDRWIRVRDLGEDGAGTLVVIEGATGAASWVDDEVHAQVTFEPHERPDERPWSTDELVYAVRDPSSPDNGLWRVAFPP